MKSAMGLMDINTLRQRLRRAEEQDSRLGRLWRTIQRQTFAAPDENAWNVVFVAALTGDKRMAEHARRIIRSYLESVEAAALSAGVHFHFWCHAFPHARWAIWFDLMRQLGLWEKDEAAEIAARFILQQYRYFYAGLMTKPHPEAVDNQTASLCLSCLVIGTLFRQGPGEDRITSVLRAEALRRAPAIIGNMPRSGYGGEGSTYQCEVVAPVMLFLAEFLERATGEDWFEREVPPQGVSIRRVLEAAARCWMPSSILLPWDNYGYQFGPKAPVAYLAWRTGDPFYAHLLNESVNFSRISSSGWGFDDLIWTLVYWPETDPQNMLNPARRAGGGTKTETEVATLGSWPSWAVQDVGGVLASADGRRYLMQMWDICHPMCSREQVNPNALVLEADGVPLTVDGQPTADCKVFDFDDTWRTVHFMDLKSRSYNFGHGAGGAHAILLVDGWEGFRPKGGYAPQRLAHFDAKRGVLVGDVTGLYRNAWPDTRCVLRKSRLVDNRFWLVEDLAVFEKEHTFDARWYFRPEVTGVAGGIDLVTAEGMSLSLRALVGPAEPSIHRIVGYPATLDGAADRVDFHAGGRVARWLWLLLPESLLEPVAEIGLGWRAWPGPAEALPRDVWAVSEDKTYSLPPDGEPWQYAEAPVVRHWWYRTRARVPSDGRPWRLVLPRSIPRGTRLWIEDEEISLGGAWPRADLLPTHVPCPASCAGKREIAILFFMPFELGHYPHRRPQYPLPGIPDGPVRLVAPKARPVSLKQAVYREGRVVIESIDGQRWEVAHVLMDEDGKEGF